MKTGIIIPCYNEEKRLNQEAFIHFIQTHDDYHLCFVNDGSKDKTLTVLKEMKSKVPSRISIVDVKRNSGKATAVRAGVRFLYQLEEIAHIGFIDADLSTDFRDFKDLVKTLKSEDQLSVVFGSRNKGKNNGIKRDFLRSIFSKCIKQFTGIILGLPIRDTQCGAKVFSRSIVPVVYGNQFISRWLFDIEIFLRLKKFLGKDQVMQHIFEQPLMRWEHVEDSKLGMKDSLQIPMRLAHIGLSYLFSNTATAAQQDFEYQLTGTTISFPEMAIAA